MFNKLFENFEDMFQPIPEKEYWKNWFKDPTYRTEAEGVIYIIRRLLRPDDQPLIDHIYYYFDEYVARVYPIISLENQEKIKKIVKDNDIRSSKEGYLTFSLLGDLPVLVWEPSRRSVQYYVNVRDIEKFFNFLERELTDERNTEYI